MRQSFLTLSRYASVLMALGSACGFAVASESPDQIRQFVKQGPPPCDVPAPSFDFMKEDGLPFSISNMTSAAWFARQVQLTSGLRQQAWEQLPIKPLKVTDFQADRWGLHATILEFESQVLVLYRGTEDVLDYVLNGTFYTTKKGQELGLPGWVHEGFLINFRLTWDRIFSALKEASAKEKSIVFAAHSLGGVLSQYAAWLAENHGMKVIRIYAFQSPNPGDLIFKNAFEERFSSRHSNTIFGEDVTPHIPPVVESVDAFARAAIRPLGALMGNWLKTARYGALGERFAINIDGVRVRVPSDAVAQSEMDYWNSYKEKSGGLAFPRGLTSDSPFIADHDIDRVLCALSKAD